MCLICRSQNSLTNHQNKDAILSGSRVSRRGLKWNTDSKRNQGHSIAQPQLWHVKVKTAFKLPAGRTCLINSPVLRFQGCIAEDRKRPPVSLCKIWSLYFLRAEQHWSSAHFLSGRPKQTKFSASKSYILSSSYFTSRTHPLLFIRLLPLCYCLDFQGLRAPRHRTNADSVNSFSEKCGLTNQDDVFAWFPATVWLFTDIFVIYLSMTNMSVLF